MSQYIECIVSNPIHKFGGRSTSSPARVRSRVELNLLPLLRVQRERAAASYLPASPFQRFSRLVCIKRKSSGRFGVACVQVLHRIKLRPTPSKAITQEQCNTNAFRPPHKHPDTWVTVQHPAVWQPVLGCFSPPRQVGQTVSNDTVQVCPQGRSFTADELLNPKCTILPSCPPNSLCPMAQLSSAV